MKKKICLGLMLACLSIGLFGCGKTTADYVEDNMSEWTSVFYYGEAENFYASISSGVREEPYLMNGSSENKVDFALLSVCFNEGLGQDLIKATLTIDGTQSEVELEINGLNNCFMVDLERRLTGDEVVTLSYEGQEISLENLSNNFVVNDQQAIEIASAELEEEITKLKSGSHLNAECYLRVLDKQANNFDGTFWCFTVINVENETYSIIISTADGSILAKT